LTFFQARYVHFQPEGNFHPGNVIVMFYIIRKLSRFPFEKSGDLEKKITRTHRTRPERGMTMGVKRGAGGLSAWVLKCDTFLLST